MSEKRNTQQKEMILAALREVPCHPTAGELYERLRTRQPRISRSTVFRVLADQAAEGRILRLHLDGEADRYDAATTPHCHVRCRLCGRVADLSWAVPALPAEAEGFLLEECAVVYRGLCPACRADEDKDSNAERRL